VEAVHSGFLHHRAAYAVDTQTGIDSFQMSYNQRAMQVTTLFACKKKQSAGWRKRRGQLQFPLRLKKQPQRTNRIAAVDAKVFFSDAIASEKLNLAFSLNRGSAASLGKKTGTASR